MRDFNFTIKPGRGKFNKLDKLYRNFVIESIKNPNENTITRWEIYDIIMNELINIGKYDCFEEVKYRITDGETPNIIMLEIINKYKDINQLMWLMEKPIENFIEEDLTNRFL